MRYFIFFLVSFSLTACKEKCKTSSHALKIYPLNKEYWKLKILSANANDPPTLCAHFIFEGDFCENSDSVTKDILSFMDSIGFVLLDTNKAAIDVVYNFYKTDKNLSKSFSDKEGDRTLDKYFRDENIAILGFNKKTRQGEIQFLKNGTDYAHVDITKKSKWELGKVEYY